MVQGVERIKSVARRIGEAQQRSGLLQPVGDFVDQFKFGLTEVVHKWAKGMVRYFLSAQDVLIFL